MSKTQELIMKKALQLQDFCSYKAKFRFAMSFRYLTPSQAPESL